MPITAWAAGLLLPITPMWLAARVVLRVLPAELIPANWTELAAAFPMVFCVTSMPWGCASFSVPALLPTSFSAMAP
ncbi:hypothetical protein [Listeria booriae]|uniref:hypothetical protein n=1 Tax=Listeria booriae TaxID=1552123 RepID=UPI0021AB7BE3|nr:hypothetical protein [Listeria booriae]